MEGHVELTGKVAMVTGASRGIGKQIAIELGRRGAAVVVAARTVEARRRLPGTIGQTVAAIEEVGAQALAVRADMAAVDDLGRLVATALERFGRVDVLVNNAAATAGKAWGAPLLELTREEWMEQYAVNLHAPYTLIRSLAPVMAEHGGGRVINLTTAGHGGDREPAPGLAVPLAYPSSKAALDAFAHLVAPQLRELGITIVNLHPGFVHTEMVDVLVENGMDASDAIPIDIPTRAVAFLATCDDPWAYTGKVVTAEGLVADIERTP
ncbi:MAG: SDR family NAD(P)-dependent oxidoreductase [Acidimicrobiales bacterium]